MNMAAIKRFKKLVKPYGVTVEGKGGHYAVMWQKRRISTLAHTGNVDTYRESIGHLVKAGAVPPELRRVKF